jgi:hypothetical protein
MDLVSVLRDGEPPAEPRLRRTARQQQSTDRSEQRDSGSLSQLDYDILSLSLESNLVFRRLRLEWEFVLDELRAGIDSIEETLEVGASGD